LRAVQQLVAQGLPTAEAARVVLRPAEHGVDLQPEAHPTAHLLTAAALDLDGPTCRSLLRDHLATHPVERTWDEVLRPVLGAIGDRWDELPHGIAVERLLSHVAAAVLGAVPTGARGRPTVLLPAFRWRTTCAAPCSSLVRPSDLGNPGRSDVDVALPVAEVRRNDHDAHAASAGGHLHRLRCAQP